MPNDDTAESPPERPIAPTGSERLADAFVRLMLPTHTPVPFLAMPAVARVRLIERVGLSADDRVIDLGCGDGSTLIDLVARTGCHAAGLELDADLVIAARAAVERSGSSDRIAIHQGDFTATHDLGQLDLAGATVAVLFLFPWAISILLPVLADAMPAGGRIASYAFGDDDAGCADRTMVEGYGQAGHQVPLFVWRVDDLARSATPPRHRV